MIFIHGKNILEFLQKLRQPSFDKVLQPLTVKALYDGFIYSLDNFVYQGNLMVKQRKEYKLLR